MVVTVRIDRWDVTRILVDIGSQVKILFLSAFESMGYDESNWKSQRSPSTASVTKELNQSGVITLPVSFGTPQNPCTDCVPFNVIDILYPYNAIFGRGLLNTFKAALHSGNLCLKIPATFTVISVFLQSNGCQKHCAGLHTWSQECAFPSRRIKAISIVCMPIKVEAPTEFKKAIEVDGNFKKVPLDPRVPNRVVCLGTETEPEEQVELLAFLDKNGDVFAWFKCEAQKVEASENFWRKSWSSEGRSLKIAGRRFHQGGNLPLVASKCGDGPEKEWKMENVHWLHWLE
jgi:hypothetical protein